MSVTFTCNAAPTKQVPCEFCRDWSAEMKDPDTGRCDQWCTGFFTQSEAPESYLTNENAADMLALLGIPQEPGDLYGRLVPEELPGHLQKIMVALNRGEGTRSHLVSEASSEVGPHGCTVHNMGNTDEQTIRRLTDLQTLFMYAAQNGYEVSWS